MIRIKMLSYHKQQYFYNIQSKEVYETKQSTVIFIWETVLIRYFMPSATYNWDKLRYMLGQEQVCRITIYLEVNNYPKHKNSGNQVGEIG